jgi:formylglycine-generating enzyme required for sulfatase activity
MKKKILSLIILAGIVINVYSQADYTETVNAVSFEMVAVRGGTFIMGCTAEQGDNCLDGEKPVHQVMVSDFYIGKYEVTQAQWKAIMGTTVVKQQRDKDNPNWALKGEGDNYPMYFVSWEEVQEFIRKLNAQTGKQYRLPAEAEWEYAARGGAKSKGYKYSGNNTAFDVAWYYENAGDKVLDDNLWLEDSDAATTLRNTNNNGTHAVGTKSPNELGLYDMSGNVWELCSDWYGEYDSNSPQNNPQGPESGTLRVCRGGAWCSPAEYARVSDRKTSMPVARYSSVGFRIACSSK